MDMDMDPQMESQIESQSQTMHKEQKFKLLAEIKSPKDDAPSFHCVACFPWRMGSLQHLWPGHFTPDEQGNIPSQIALLWHGTVQKWSRVFAIGGGRKVRLMATAPSRPAIPLFTISIPDINLPAPKPNIPAGVTAIAWCMTAHHDEFIPLLAFSSNSLIYVFDLQKGEFIGVIRGHGAEISSLCVHPKDPSILCSTSHDHTARLYDLREPVFHPREVIDLEIDPFCKWPGKNKPCLAGPAFGLRVNDGEGLGLGRCIAVLAGGASGGHQAAVLNAAFHPTRPIVATCGMDNSVKLWPIPSGGSGSDGREPLRRADKPLFSSSRIHSSHVLSITWISDDVLLSHSGPGIVRASESDSKDKSLASIPGSLVLWRWLGIERFFPSEHRSYWRSNVRGCASDYQDSSSFKIISSMALPSLKPTRLHVDHSFRGPSVLFPSLYTIKGLELKQMKPRDRDVCPKVYKPVATHSMHKLNSADDFKDITSLVNTVELEACTTSEDSSLLIGVGARESIYIWRALDVAE